MSAGGLSIDHLAPLRVPGEAAQRYFALDPRLRDKKALLEAERETTWVQANAVTARIRKLAEERGRKQSTFNYEASGVLTGVRKELTPEQQREIEYLTEQIGRLERLGAVAEAHRVVAARVHDAVAAYRERADLSTVTPIPIERVRAADLAVELVGIRRTLGELAQEEQTVSNAPLPLAEALEQLESEIARRVTWEPDAGSFFWPARADRPRTLIPDPVSFRPGARGLVPGARDIPGEVTTERAFEAFLVVLFQKTIRQLWVDAIKASVPNATAVPAKEKPVRLADIAKRRHALWLEEEAVVLTAAERGVSLDRRGEADPAVVLRTVLATA